jgi:hypothetical protein
VNLAPAPRDPNASFDRLRASAVGDPNSPFDRLWTSGVGDSPAAFVLSLSKDEPLCRRMEQRLA